MRKAVVLKPIDVFITITIMFASIGSSIMILFDISDAISNRYGMLFLLPISYLVAFLFILLRGEYYTVKGSLVGIIVFGVYFVRTVITPLTMPLADYASVMGENFATEFNGIAVLMVFLETIVVGVYLPDCIRKGLSASSREEDNWKDLNNQSNKPSKLIWAFVFILIALILLILRMDSSIIKSEFLFLLDTNKQYYALSETASGLGTLSMWAEIMEVFFRIVQVLLPPLLIWNFSNMRLPNIVKYLLSFVVFAAVSSVGTENRIDAIFAGVAVLLSMRKLYGKKFHRQFKIWALIIIAGTAFGLAIKSGLVSRDGSGSVDFSNISVMFTAYFSGIHTVSASISMISADRMSLNILKLVPDALSKIPFFAYALQLFTGISLRNSNQLFNDFISGVLGRSYGQILPTTALGYEYFSVLYFLLPCLLIRLSVFFENKIGQQKDIVHLNLYYWITICVACSPVIASGLLVVAKLSWFAVIWLILRMYDRKKRN